MWRTAGWRPAWATARGAQPEGIIVPGSVEHPVILVANRKGGTGKTTVAVNLAAELVRTHGPTLLVDIDPQGHAGLGTRGDRQGRRADGP